MTIQTLLESFESQVVDSAAPAPEFERGYEEGFAAAQAAASADATQLNDKLVQSIADINFTYAEARSQVLRSLGPLFDMIARRALPHCVANGFAEQLAQHLVEIAGTDVGSMSLHVHPDQVERVKATMGETAIKVAGDPNLTPFAAWVGQSDRETLIDMDGLLAGISEALSAISSYQKDNAQDG